MADKEQLEILKQGVDIWNKWREDNTNVDVDLRGAGLREADLWNVNLMGTNLKEADLWGADLTRANLKGAILRGANLKGADLTKADLTEADLLGADFREAWLGDSIFIEADLSKARLTGANLSGSNLQWARIGITIFGDNDLSNAFGLEKIIHFGPSIIGTDTIQKSKGKIPVEFLRGCGLSDLEIEFSKLFNPNLNEKEITDVTYKIHELRTKGVAIHYSSTFISFSFNDRDFATRLHNDLQNNGVRCWFAPHDIQGGQKIHEQIDRAIQAHDRLLLILSESSMNSEWVNTEIAHARQKEVNENRQVLFPISIVDYKKIRDWKNFDADTGKDSAREIREYYIPDFSNWKDKAAYQPSFERLLRDLTAL